MDQKQIILYNYLLEALFSESNSIWKSISLLKGDLKSIDNQIKTNNTHLEILKKSLVKDCQNIALEIDKINDIAKQLGLNTTNSHIFINKKRTERKMEMILHNDAQEPAIHLIINIEFYAFLLIELELLKEETEVDIAREKRYIHQYNLSKKLGIWSIILGSFGIAFGIVGLIVSITF
ncbi:hypothetical protein [Mariniplasma anaerobium]|uniref:Uncharacterized protein n=1 Tax=Mariniplasma anaerobium TaxID=2735436 RepID=A0A7U9XVH3_9MOLU|nr:hypothetical protein [Mariniplasma anaerobium]BCR35562.1 hypothetical protein MPAN_004550 [Mariniplasma anaerobium]